MKRVESTRQTLEARTWHRAANVEAAEIWPLNEDSTDRWIGSHHLR